MPVLTLFGANNKPHGVHVLGKYYDMCFDPKIGDDTCAIGCISFECLQCTSALDLPWNPGVSPHQQPHYQPIKDFIYRHALDSFNN